MRLVLGKRFVTVIAVCMAVGAFKSAAADEPTSQIQKEFQAAKVAADAAQATLKKAEAEAAATEEKLNDLKARIAGTKAQATKLRARREKLAVKLKASQEADRLSKIADASAGRRSKAQAAVDHLEKQLQTIQQDLAARTSTVLQTQRLIKEHEGRVKPQQDAIAKAKAAKDAADKAAAGPRKTIADAAKTAADKKAMVATTTTNAGNTRKSADAAKSAAESLKVVVELAKQAATSAKGTAAEKATADSVVTQIDAMRKVGQVAAELDAKAKTLEAALKEYQAALVTAETNLKKVTDAGKAQLDAASKANATHATATKALAETQKTIAVNKPKLAEATEWKVMLESRVAALKPSVQKAKVDFKLLNDETVQLKKQAEDKLIAVDRLVSFSDKVAPIFAQRCLACHNARTAKGRYNMESFASIMKSGESGDASIAHSDVENSYLFTLISEGEMPRDSEPLSKDEIATIRKWIETGASLNAGVKPTAQLIQITPTVAQPMPPEEYRMPMPVTAVAFSADGKRLATSGYHEVLIWDATSGKQLQRVTNVAERVYDIEFSPDGTSFAVAAGTPAETGELKVFANDGRLLADLIRTDDSVFSATYSSDGRRLAASGADRTIRVFDVASWDEQLRIEDHADWVIDVAWSLDGKKIASASRDKTAKVFDARTGDSVVTFNGHAMPVFGVGFLPDGNSVVSGGRDKTLRVWNVANAKEVRKIGGFGDEVFRINVTPKGTVFSSSADQFARLHQLSNGKETQKFAGHTDWVYSVAYSTATNRVATGSYNGEVRIWNPDDGKSLLEFVAIPGSNAPKTASK